MKNIYSRIVMGSLVVALSVLPAAAFAKSDALGVHLKALSVLHIGGEDTADAAVQATTTASTSSSSVGVAVHAANYGQLRSTLNHLIKLDAQADSQVDAQASSTTLKAHYEVPAKFLWTIPSSISADVVEHADGTVSVTYPWYAFLFTTQADTDLLHK